MAGKEERAVGLPLMIIGHLISDANAESGEGGKKEGDAGERHKRTFSTTREYGISRRERASTRNPDGECASSADSSK